MQQSKKTQKLVILGMLSSIAYILMMINFPIPGLPPFLTIDFSEIPALVAALVFGPMAAVIVEGIKNLLNYLIQGSATGVPVGQVANFVAGLLFVLPVSYMFRRFKTAKGVTIGLVTGTVVMTVLMAVLNYYVFLPAYTIFLQSPEMSSEQARQYIVAGILPFNLIKGVATGVIFVLLFSKMKQWITRRVAV
ncbi:MULTISPECIES: ECF transporter S component [Priestia]|uniref:ECF transporter S component n=1 Tax=Priestia megaterium TaxID=1404 RepID=UPI0012B8259C|nr:ECF transporter S component [Priestia megaterium]